MTTPFLIADAAEVAIMSPLAEAAFGSYDLQVPEGIDIEDIHDFEAPGNELGYVARLSPQRATGIARRFIRADVAVTAKDDTDPDVIPESDVDRVLSEAESRVESEFFLESDITKAGLGAWVPYVDFNVGDIVNVRIFDIWVTLPVTRIEPIISEGDVVDWRVHVGGQLLSDDQAREVENATIQKELIQDRRDLAGIDAKATRAVKESGEAKAEASDAQSAAESADGKAEQAKDGAVEVDESTAEALQAETENILNQLREQQEDLARIQSESVNVLMATKAGATWPGVEIVAGINPGTTWGFNAPDSRGALVHAEHYRKGEASPNAQVKFKENLLPPTPGGWFIDAADDEYIRLTWAKPSAFQRGISELSTSGFSPERGEWVTVDGLGVTAGNAASNGLLTVKVRWNAASRSAQYGIRLLVDGVVTGQRISTKIGPLSFLGDGTVTQTINVPNISVPAGRRVDVQVMSGAIASSARRVSRVELSGSWIETAA
ncbi:hypothetical protein ACTXJY_00175 [Corynebacterium casei]|uniref:hypothetical protein n=1 Tax=Corynebacterium casei TaxID=160386 RepID=UPI003FD4DD45